MLRTHARPEAAVVGVHTAFRCPQVADSALDDRTSRTIIGRMHARPLDVPATLRTVRNVRRLSQRDLAAYAGVPPSTIDRIESGTTDPRVSTLAKVLAAVGVELKPCIGRSVLEIDPDREKLRDSAARHLPPHWIVERIYPNDSWWGWWRKHPNVAQFPLTHTYWRRWNRNGQPDASGLAYLWQDAT